MMQSHSNRTVAEKEGEGKERKKERRKIYLPVNVKRCNEKLKDICVPLKVAQPT